MALRGTRPPGPPKADVAARLCEAMNEYGRRAASDLSEASGVSLQAITGWRKTGRIHRKHLNTVCTKLGVNEAWLAFGVGPKYRVREDAGQYIARPRASDDELNEFIAASPDERRMALEVIRMMRGTRSPENDDDAPPPAKSSRRGCQ